MENFELQSLREVVKTNGPDVVKNFEEKFKEIRVEGKRKSLKDNATHYTESPPTTYYTEAEQEQIEAMYMGKESESRKLFDNSRTRTPSQNSRQRTFSQSGYNTNDFRAKRDRTRSPGRRQDQPYQGRSRTPSRNQPFSPVRCIGFRCNSCYNNKKTLQEIKDLLSKKLDVKLVGQDPPCKCKSV